MGTTIMGSRRKFQVIVILLIVVADQGFGLPMNNDKNNVVPMMDVENIEPKSGIMVQEVRHIKRRDVGAVAVQDMDEETNADRIFYPMLISKKSATALNKLIYALKTSFDSASFEKDIQGLPFTSSKSIRNIQISPSSNSNYDPYNPHLQRRGQQKDRKNYLRCYFNAVSCF